MAFPPNAQCGCGADAKYKVVIADMDGTVVDSTVVCRSCGAQIAEAGCMTLGSD